MLSSTNKNEINQFIDSQMHKYNVPGLFITTSDHCEVIFNGSYGFRNVDTGAKIDNSYDAQHVIIRKSGEQRKKRLMPETLKKQTVYIDGFNLIITLEVALSDGMLFIGQDGCIRDLAEMRGTYRLIPQTETAIQMIHDILFAFDVGKVVFMLDEPVSNSGRLKTKIYELDWPIPVEVQIIRSPDAALKRLPCVITGDSIILDSCESWFNMMAYCIETREDFKKLNRLVHLGYKGGGAR